MMLALSISLLSRHSFVLLLSGFLMGLAFHSRYQCGLMIAGYFAWLLVYRRELNIIAKLIIGLCLGLFLGILADRWGWGDWHFTAWNYLRIQLLDGKVNEFGVSPWWHYFNCGNISLLVAQARSPPNLEHPTICFSAFSHWP